MAEAPAPAPSESALEQSAASEFEAECAEALAAIEHHIYTKEGEYLEKTHGNIARGWEGFLDTRAGAIQKRRFDDKDRLFSFSSWTFCSANPHLFNSRDDDPDNWCLANRKRTHHSISGLFHAQSGTGLSGDLIRPRKKRKT